MDIRQLYGDRAHPMARDSTADTDGHLDANRPIGDALVSVVDGLGRRDVQVADGPPLIGDLGAEVEASTSPADGGRDVRVADPSQVDGTTATDDAMVAPADAMTPRDANREPPSDGTPPLDQFPDLMGGSPDCGLPMCGQGSGLGPYRLVHRGVGFGRVGTGCVTGPTSGRGTMSNESYRLVMEEWP